MNPHGRAGAACPYGVNNSFLNIFPKRAQPGPASSAINKAIRMRRNEEARAGERRVMGVRHAAI